MLQWSIDHNVLLHFIDPGKPAQNAWIESFNSRVRDEFLNVQYFKTLPEIREQTGAARRRRFPVDSLEVQLFYARRGQKACIGEEFMRYSSSLTH